MNNIISLSFENKEFRTFLDDDNEVWFVAKDIADALGYADPDQAIRQHCPEAVKLNTRLIATGKFEIHANSKVIPEWNLYELIFSSELESAKRFRRWVTKDVLPSIRKHGTYPPPSQEEQAEVLLLEHHEYAVKGLRVLKDMTHGQRVAAAREILSEGDFDITKILSEEMKADLRYFSEHELQRRGHYTSIHYLRDALVSAGLYSPDLYLTDLGRRFGKCGLSGIDWRLETLDYIKGVAERRYREWKSLSQS